MLRRTRLFHGTLVVVLILSIGSAAAVLNVAQSVLSRALPFRDGHCQMEIWSTLDSGAPSSVSLPDFMDWARQNHSFEGMAAVQMWPMVLTLSGSAPQIGRVAMVSGEFFDVLGANALSGRLLDSNDDGLNAPCRVVLSEAFERRSRDQVPSLNRTLSIALGRAIPCTVVGVAAPKFDFVAPELPAADLWVTLGAVWPSYADKLKDRDDQAFHVLGRLQSGVSPERAQQELATISARIAHDHPGHRLGVGVAPLHEQIVAPARPRVYRLLLGTVVGALAMCLNLGGLTLLHVRERRRELALRAVLGATPWRIRRQLFTEMSLTVALALPGACAWCGWLMNLLFTTLTPSRGRAWPELQGGVGWLVLCSLVALAMTLLCGLLPASIVTRPDVASSLWQAGTRNPEGPWLRSMRGTLIAAQIALGCVLLSMSGAAVRAVRALAGSELGYRPEGLVFASLYDARGDQRDAQVRQAYVRVLEKVRSQPGVRAAAISLGAPLYGIFSRDFFERQGDGPAARTSAVRNVVMPGYFEAMGIPLLQGRDFGDADSALEHHVVILGEKLARRLFPDGGAVGQTLLHRSWFGPLPLRVIGVAGDVRRGGYAGAMDDDAYVSMNAYTQLGTDLIVRLDPDQMNTLMTQLPGWLPATDGILLGPPWAFPAGLERSLQSERRLSGTLLAFGTAATLLSVLGVFALTSHNVQRRTRELSIRVALGCPARRILWLVLAPVTGWVVLGIGVAGALLGCVGDRVMLALSAGDGSPMAAFPWAAVVLALCALAACVGPTSRALRVSGGLAVREP